MSVVSNCILAFSLAEGHREGLDLDGPAARLVQVNRFFTREDSAEWRYAAPGFTEVKNYGGNKCLECCVAVGAFNFLNEPDLLNHIRSIRWDAPELVQLIIRRHGEDVFSIVEPFAPRLDDDSDEDAGEP